MGYRQVLHGCEAGGQWLLQGAGYCFHQEVAWFFPEIAKFLPSSPHTTFSARESLDIGSRSNVRWACFTDNKHILFFSDYPCDMIPILNVVLFKTADSTLDIREKAAQLLQLLERYLLFICFFFSALWSWGNEWVNEWMIEWTIEWKKDKVIERTIECLSEWKNEWMVIVTTCTVTCSLASDRLIFL